MREPVVMSWSGGKDSAMALYDLLGNTDYEVVELMATVSEEYRRISHHGVREELLDAQAAVIGIPLRKVCLPSDDSAGCTNQVYEAIMNRVMDDYKAKNVNTVAFGDLFLEDLRAWREANLAKVGMRGLFPIWKRDTRVMAHEVIRLGYKAYLSCVEAIVGADFVGRLYDENLLSDLPPMIDPCGENGEFHSFVFDGPTFARPLPIKVGERVTRNGRFYADLLLEPSPKLDECTPQSIPPV
jgi:uncharacterized protein (TIGR00290 family)